MEILRDRKAGKEEIRKVKVQLNKEFAMKDLGVTKKKKKKNLEQKF